MEKALKITVYTSNQPRHVSLIEKLSRIADVHAVIETVTNFPGRFPGFYPKSERMERYFDRVRRAEVGEFGPPRSLDACASVWPLNLGDLSYLNSGPGSKLLETDLQIVFGSSLIRGALLENLVARRAVNIHMGLSPYYRGTACNFWALYDRNPHLVGGTVHLLSSKIDGGDILFRTGGRFPASSLEQFTMSAVAEVHDALVDAIADNSLFSLKSSPQDPELEVRYSRNRDFTDNVVDEFEENREAIEMLVAELERNGVEEALYERGDV